MQRTPVPLRESVHPTAWNRKSVQNPPKPFLHNFCHHKDCPGDSRTRPSAGSKRNLPVRFSQNANELTRSLYDLNWWGLQRQCCEPTSSNEAKDYRS